MDYVSLLHRKALIILYISTALHRHFLVSNVVISLPLLHVCSEPDSFCPPSCPEHMFSSLSWMIKRDQELGRTVAEFGKQGVGSVANPKKIIPNPSDADLGSSK